MNRRRAITVIGAAALTSCRRRDPLRTFSSIGFGTNVGFQVYGLSESDFKKISDKCTSRLREMESLFSLYDPESAISKLNREGSLEGSDEFAQLVDQALFVGAQTDGIFDITVQPLWDWRQKWKEADLAGRKEMEGDAWKESLALVDFRKVSISQRKIEFLRAGMSITLNGIVQGYATDQILSLLKKHGIANALVNIGEYAALGNAPDGKPWMVELSATGERIPLHSGRALAVSAGSGHTFDPEGRFHHIFRPSDGANLRPTSTIVVTAKTATVADALSTTLAIASEPERKFILGKFPGADFREIE